jgi:hypothetical protein
VTKIDYTEIFIRNGDYYRCYCMWTCSIRVNCVFTLVLHGIKVRTSGLLI